MPATQVDEQAPWCVVSENNPTPITITTDSGDTIIAQWPAPTDTPRTRVRLDAAQAAELQRVQQAMTQKAAAE